MAKDSPTLVNLVRQVIPFRFISPTRMTLFLKRCDQMRYDANERIIEQDDVHDKRVFLILSGKVEVTDKVNGNSEHVSVIETLHYFGEWEAIFDLPRHYGIRALESCDCLVFSQQEMLDLLRQELAFSQALASILRERQGIFRAFELFTAELVRAVAYGYISIQKLLPLYQGLEPALHPFVRSKEVLDASALDYAVRRLPKNVTTTFAFLIRDELPSVYQDPDLFFKAVLTDGRRRSIWEVMPGKDMVLARVGMSDICDLVSCLCLYATEARKIRRFIYTVKGVQKIKDFLNRTAALQVLPEIAAKNEVAKGEDALLLEIGFPQQWVAGIRRVWPNDPIGRVWDLVNHREMFTIDVRTRQTSYDLKDFAKWSSQIGEATRMLFGCDPAELDNTVHVHIISSNTHSVSNCLNPWFTNHAPEILAWAESIDHPFARQKWVEKSDQLYALARDYFRSHEGSEEQMLEVERQAGIVRLGATASTGIEVQLIRPSLIKNQKVDPSIKLGKNLDNLLIVNIDFAFGEQAENIIHQLILLFGRTIKSANFLGKAGSLQGKRGDILVPSSFLEQEHDLFIPLASENESEIDSLSSMAQGRSILRGPMLTVKGTLMQNKLMYLFYQRMWDVVGIEMEGMYYHRQMLESIHTGLLDSSTRARFLYYVSDLPLDPSGNLSERLDASEGVPPLYTITRHVLRSIFSK